MKMAIMNLIATAFAIAGLFHLTPQHSRSFSIVPGMTISVLRLSSFATSAYQLRKPKFPFRRFGSSSSSENDSKRRYRNLESGDGDEDYTNLRLRREAIQCGLIGMAVKSKAGGKRPQIDVSNVHELRVAVLDEKHSFSQVNLANQLDAAIQEQIDETFLQNHTVLQLMKERFETGSKPGHRQDNASLALAIEGGGMRGCVSAGMAAAVASLGLTDAFDKIYGSSAGSVIGSYMVSRQMCVDVYVDILPAAKKKFVCKRRLVSSIAQSLVEVLKNYLSLKTISDESFRRSPGMNISFVLDSIMGQDHGVRPLDFDSFTQNSLHQELRIVASCVDEQGQLVTKCFGADDFYGNTAMRTVDGEREGLFACLQASMTVPAATGPPVELTKVSMKMNATESSSLHCFDAFCFEPIPYRSAVEEGATHVLALSSRPLGFQPKSKPGVYDTTAAPLYFYSHGQGKVANFFENGGQQYLYAEDLLTLQDAKRKLHEPVLVPPPKILYGLGKDRDHKPELETINRNNDWKRAHLLPIQVPPTAPELGALTNDKDEVLEAVRGGYSAAFNILAPLVGLKPDLMGVSGCEVAKLVFPDSEMEQMDTLAQSFDSMMLQTKVQVPGDPLLDGRTDDDTRLPTGMPIQGNIEKTLSHTLLSTLPGFKGGRLHHLSKGLRYGSTLYSDNEQMSSGMAQL
jgi:hypothetical protein